jgi:hypothetical protein
LIRNTAIIFFSRSAKAELKHKTFCGSNAFVNRSVAGALYSRSLQEVKRAGLPWFVFDEHNQAGRSFGERLSNAFSEVFAMGFTAAIAVGSDSPGLEASHIQQAAILLEGNAMVAGPTQAGGSYLLGLQQQDFQPTTFAALPWQSPKLMQELLHQFREHIKLLPVVAELNNEQQVLHMAWQPLAAMKFISRFIQFLRSLFNNLANGHPQLKLLPLLALPVCRGRAP